MKTLYTQNYDESQKKADENLLMNFHFLSSLQIHRLSLELEFY